MTASATPLSPSQLAALPIHLDELRESGETNMFGARPFLEARFGLPKAAASAILGYWMKSFTERHPR